ncbi:MAG: PDZ domain-containing protein [Bacteroidales bacterium]|nr:PDZ domain-containing protein [Bacteroidales bacterium]
MKKNTTFFIIQPIIFAILFIGGIYFGKYLPSNEQQPVTKINSYSPTNSYAYKLNEIIDYIAREYVDSVNLNDLTEKTINTMLMNLDPHSIYIPPMESKNEMDELAGQFDGIGVQFSIQKDTIIVVAVISGGPSEKIGLHPGDRIVMVDDTLVAGVNIANFEVMKKLKGPQGTKVKVSIKRSYIKNLLEFTITRDVIPFNSIDAAFPLDNKTGYVKISRFAQTTHDEFVKAVKKLHNKNIHRLIIDLRGNGGGFLDAATNMANEFLPEGKLIVFTKGRVVPRRNIYATAEGHCLNDKVIILIDEWSASASEILSGAIQDNDRGIIVGRRSFGKGLVQEPVVFSDKSSLRLTVARYYSPTGRCIQRPYGDGRNNYYNEIYQRFANGQLIDKDSIHFPDSLKYKTPKGKIVYGGGGIMPDVFVPIDTSRFDAFYYRVMNKSLYYSFAFDYADVHRAQMNKFKDYKQLLSFLKKQPLWDEFKDFVIKKENIECKAATCRSKPLILNYIYAFIIRNIIGEDGFYTVFLQNDKTLKKAQKLIESE